MALVQTSREYGLYFHNKFHCHFPPLRSALNQPLPQGFLRVYGPFQKQMLFVCFFFFISFYFFEESASVVILFRSLFSFFSPLLLFLLFYLFFFISCSSHFVFLFSLCFISYEPLVLFLSLSRLKKRTENTTSLFGIF